MALLNGEIARITASLLYKGSDQIQNVWHAIKVSGANSDSAVSLACREMMESTYIAINADMSEEMSYDFIDVFFIPGSQALGQFSWPALTVGVATGDVTAPGVCMLSLGRTGVSRRVGRKYFGAYSEAKIDDGVWPALQIANASAAALIAYSNFTATNGVVMRAIVYDVLLAVARDAITLVSDGIPAYQRRRRQGVGS